MIYNYCKFDFVILNICTACNGEDTALNTETPQGQKLLEEFKNKQ